MVSRSTLARDIPPAMHRTVDPHRFRGLPLIMRASTETDFSVSCDSLRAGRIMRQTRSFGKEVWFWTVTGPALAQAGLASSGEAETLEEARNAFRRAFDEWLTWATAQPGPVHWHD